MLDELMERRAALGQRRAEAETALAAHLATEPQCGKPGAGFKAHERRSKELREEVEEVWALQSMLGLEIADYERAGDLTFARWEVQSGAHHDIRRRTQEARRAEVARRLTQD
jgi:hypothetical protein